MNLKNLTDQNLLLKTEKLICDERQLLTEILHHLKEIETRRLFSKLGHSSMLDYCVKKLKYSESQALRRISAARLIKEIPEVEAKISSGALTLTNVSQAQSFFRSERKDTKAQVTQQSKKQVLQQLENKSSREGQKILFSLASNPQQASKRSFEKKRLVTAELTEIRFAADEELLCKMSQVKGLLAHKHPQLTTSELLDVLCDLAIEKLDASKKTVASKGKSTKPKLTASKPKGCRPKTQGTLGAAEKTNPSESTDEIIQPTEQKPNTAPPAAKLALSRQRKRKYLSVHIKRAVWRKAKGRCENCESKYGLEIDHQVPLALGGDDNINNLRLLCRYCNQRAAVECFGQGKIRNYIK